MGKEEDERWEKQSKRGEMITTRLNRKALDTDRDHSSATHLRTPTPSTHHILRLFWQLLQCELWVGHTVEVALSSCGDAKGPLGG